MIDFIKHLTVSILIAMSIIFCLMLLLVGLSRYSTETIRQGEGVVVGKQVRAATNDYEILIEDDGIIYIADYNNKVALDCGNINETVQYKITKDVVFGITVEIVNCEF